MAKFKVHARILDLLGVEQIADMPTAVSELFKNAYDAYADNVALELFRHKEHAILWDDGVGMSLDDVENRWLVVGTPGKKLSPPAVRDGYEPRPLMGEKGIGRLAISTLGDTLLLISKRECSQPDCCTALFLNWRVARNHKLMLDDFEIPVLPFALLDDFTSDIFGMLVDEFNRQLDITSKDGKWEGYEDLLEQIRAEVDTFDPDLSLFLRTGAFTGKSGTAFYLGNVTDEVRCLTKPKDRFDTTDKSVYDQVVLLLSNFSKSRIAPENGPKNTAASRAKKDFYTDVRIWDVELAAPTSVFEDQALFQPDDLEQFDHYFDIAFDASGRYSGTILRYGEELELPAVEQQPVTRETKCGPFRFRFWCWQGDPKETLLDQNAMRIIDEKLKYSGGIMVYRDGLRVLPYGVPENDWLEIEERRSRGAGYYFFSYRRMFGYVSIGTGNSQLRDKAGREGLIKNGAYRDFRSTLKTFLVDMAARYFRDNPGFRARQDRVKAENEALSDHKKGLNEKRKKLQKELEAALPAITRQHARLLELKEGVQNKLNGPDLSVENLEEAVSAFEKRVQQLLGEARVTIPKSLSLGRGRELNQVAFDYGKAYKALQTEAEAARDQVFARVGADSPAVEKRMAQRRLLENALSIGKMRIGRAFTDLSNLADEKTSTIASRINEIRADALKQVEDALLKATSASSIADAIGTENGVETAIKQTSAAADSGEEVCLQLKERLSQILDSAMSEDSALVMAVQDDRIEELEKKIQETVELAQIGLSVEMIHHDLHGMFRGISGSIRTLRHMFAKIPEAMNQLNTLYSTFQHLELRYRQLEPLYRASYRTKKEISGQSILDFVQQFLAHDLDVVGVSLEPTERFLGYTIREAPALVYPAFVNLVDNAVYWLRSVEHRAIRFDVVNDAIIVNDSGPGIHETMLQRVFEAFTTTKPDGRGLGLHIARQSLSLANHEIWATNDSAYRTEPGACFCLKFSEKARNYGKEDGKDAE